MRLILLGGGGGPDNSAKIRHGKDKLIGYLLT